MEENEKKGKIRKITVNDLVKCALFIALIVIGTYTKIPIYIVPITLQFLFTNLTALLLGGRLSALTIGMYILMGLFGLPVFTAGGGPSYIIHPTFGYILGFMVGGYIAGRMTERMKKKTVLGLLRAGCVNLLTVYIMGVIYYYWIARLFLTPVPLLKLIWGGAIIFLPVDVASCIIGAFVAKRILHLKY